MRIATVKNPVLAVVVFAVLSPVPSAHAQIPAGTWVRQQTPSMPAMTMTVQPCCGRGQRLTYHFVIDKKPTVLTVESALDGNAAPVLIGGKPSGETMAMRQTDAHHGIAILKLNGRLFGTATSALSADGRKLTVFDDFSSSVGGNPVGKYTEIWIRQ